MKPDLQILLDMDGVLADFFNSALLACRNANLTELTSAEYQETVAEFNMAAAFDISQERFWSTIDVGSFWESLNVMPGALDLYDTLAVRYRVTIASSPSLNPECIPQKIRWLKKHDLTVTDCMFGSRKDLMARPGNVLIDDYPGNVEKFRAAGGQAILVPSNWNTPGFNGSQAMAVVIEELNKITYSL